MFDEYGDGDRHVVLIPGLLFSRKMHAPLATELAERGHHVLCLDLLGHGESDRPPEMWSYSMTIFGRQTIGLLDHLGIERAVIGGTSLGANATLEAAAVAPDRVQGMLVEMPVLDNALLGCAIAFTPLLLWLTFGAPVARLVGRGASLVPRGNWLLGDLLLDWAAQDPKPSASVLQGLFFGRTAPPRDERARLEAPALVIGHPARPDPSLLGLRHARARASERAPGRGQLDPRAAPLPRAPDRRDRALRRELLRGARPGADRPEPADGPRAAAR